MLKWAGGIMISAVDIVGILKKSGIATRYDLQAWFG